MRARVLLALLAVAAVVSAGCLGQGSPLDGNESLEGQNQSPGEGNRSGNASGEAPDDGDGEDDDGSSSDGNETDDDQGAGENVTEPSDPPASWPPMGEASVRPGVQVISDGRQCTSNFLFRTPDNRTLMLGIAAHCVAEGSSDSVDGCDPANEPIPLGSEVKISGANAPGLLVYSSWHTMQAVDESKDAACTGNDFALVAISPTDRTNVHPSVRHFGGPSGLAGAPSVGDKVIWYGNSGLRGGVEETNDHEGYVVDTGGWSANVYTLSPGVPGDSGSGIMTGDGQALGVLSTVEISPRAGSNGVSLLQPALQYAQEKAGLPVELVPWQQLDEGRLP